MNQNSKFKVRGMTCASCVLQVETAILKSSNVRSATVNLAMETAQVQWKSAPSPEQVEALRNQVRESGYELVTLIEGASSIEPDGALSIWEWLRLLSIGGATTVLMFPMVAMVFGSHIHFPWQFEFALAFWVQTVGGWGFYRSAFLAIRNRHLNMDVLVVLGTTSALVLSLVSEYRYFESSASIIAFVLFGKFLERKAKQSTLGAIRELESLTPHTIEVIRRGTRQRVSRTEIRFGDEVEVQPGERIPVDGLVLSGESHVDDSFLTGESLPQAVRKGSKVHGGSLNLEGRIRVTVLALSGQTLLDRMIESLIQAQSKKAPIQKKVDQWSARFVPAILLIAALTLVLWALFANTTDGLLAAISVLVIACPCALGLATPTAILVGTGVAAKEGILIRDPGQLEALKNLRVIAFDKTGTLTTSVPSVRHVQIWGPLNHARLQDLVRGMSHPYSKAIGEWLKKQVQGSVGDGVSKIQVALVPGKGVLAQGTDEQWGLGSTEWLQELKVELPNSTALKNQKNGAISWFFGRAPGEDRLQVLAQFEFEDTLRPAAADALMQLKQLKLKLVLLSGDREESVSKTTQQLTLNGTELLDEVYFGMSPEQKLEAIEELQKKYGPIAMVGDGMNDTSALARADVSMAMGMGTEAAKQSAGMVLLRNDLSQISQAIRLGQEIDQKIRQNLLWAFGYNVVAVPLAALGALNPMWAGLAMALSSVSVVTNSLRLKLKTHPRPTASR